MDKDNKNIELRSKKMQTVMRRIPRSLLWWNAAVIAIVAVALVTAWLLIRK